MVGTELAAERVLAGRIGGKWVYRVRSDFLRCAEWNSLTSKAHGLFFLSFLFPFLQPPV